MGAKAATYSMTVRVQSPSAHAEDYVVQVTFRSEVPAADLAARLTEIVDQHLAVPGTKSRLQGDAPAKRAVRSPGLY